MIHESHIKQRVLDPPQEYGLGKRVFWAVMGSILIMLAGMIVPEYRF